MAQSLHLDPNPANAMTLAKLDEQNDASQLLNDDMLDVGVEEKDPSVKENTGRWTFEEHKLFLSGLEKHGKGWKKIASLIKTRTVVQIRTHAQKYFQKLAKAQNNAEAQRAARHSGHGGDNTLAHQRHGHGERHSERHAERQSRSARDDDDDDDESGDDD